MWEAWGQPDPLLPEGIPLQTWGQLEKMTWMEGVKWHEKVSKGWGGGGALCSVPCPGTLGPKAPGHAALVRGEPSALG